MDNPELIYKLYSGKIYNLAYRMTGNTSDAGDITQDTFVQALKSLDRFKGESQIYTWLYKIAKNNCLKLLAKRDRTTLGSLEELIHKASTSVSEEIPENDKMLYITQVKDGCLSGLLRCLSLQQRLAFILNILLEVPLEQVANIIGKSENATRILIHRSRQNIKEFLCNNCSLYDSKNACRCENLINFSLKQGWIGLDKIADKTVQIESEIRDLKNELSLYKSLQLAVPGSSLDKQIRLLLTEKKNLLILSDKKVK